MGLYPLEFGPKIAVPDRDLPTGWTQYMVTRHGEVNTIADRAAAYAISLHEHGDAGTGSGTQDDTVAFRAAVAACPAGGTIACRSDKTYRIQLQADGKCVEVTKGITIDLRGANLTYKPWDSASPAAVHSPAFYFHGSSGTAYAINAATTYGNTVTTTTAADAGNFAAGDWVRINTNATKQAWNYPDGFYNTFGSAEELQLVESVNASTGVVTLAGSLDNLYPANATITKVTLLANCGVKNIGTATEDDAGVASSKNLGEDVGHLVSMNLTLNAVVENIANATNFRMFCVWSSRNVACKVFNVNGKTDGTYIAQGGHSYLVRHQSSRGALTVGCTSDNVRHLLDYTMSYDCTSIGNIARRGESGFLTHGFGARRIKSYGDSSYDSTEGWGFGDTAFGSDYEAWIEDFTYVGSGRGISVTSACEQVTIVNPNCRVYGASDSACPVLVTGAAKKVRIKGGILDTSACTNANVHCLVATGGATPGYTARQINTASATRGTDVTVTVTTTSAHGWSTGQSVYMGLYDTANGEYAGDWVITVTDATTFTFVRTGTTTQDLAATISPFRPVWKSGNKVDNEDLDVDGVYMKGHASQVSAIDFGGKGRQRIANCVAELNSATFFARFADYQTKVDPTIVEVTGNRVTGAHTRLLDLERVPTKALIVRDNIDTEYTETGLNLSVPSYVGTSYFAYMSFVGNIMPGNSPSVGICNKSLWDVVKAGGTVSGNQYPTNATITHATNKNYEWGNFTPTIAGGTTAGTASYTNQTGRYQLIGRALHVNLRLNWNTFTGTGLMCITPMPYANSGVACPCSVAEVGGLAYTGLIHPSWTSNYIQLRQQNAGTLQDIPADASADMVLAAILPLTGA